MSTDYGLICVDCNSEIIIGNCRHEEVIRLYRARFALAELWRVLRAVNSVPNMFVEISSDDAHYWQPGLPKVAEWIYNHPDHNVLMADQYDNVYDVAPDGKNLLHLYERGRL